MSSAWDLLLGEIWKRSRFTSYFYQGVEFIETDSIPTLALTVYERRLAMFFNMTFMSERTQEEMIGLLVHEMLHVVFSHDHRSIPDGDIYLQNLAQDMVINSFIVQRRKTFFSRKQAYRNNAPELVLPEGLPVIPEKFSRETGKEDPAWEDVYHWLKNIPRTERKLFKGRAELDGKVTTPSEYQAVIDSLNESLENVLGLPDEDLKDETYTRLVNQDGLVFQDDDGNELPTGIHLLRNHDYRNQMDAKKKQLITLPDRDIQCRDERIYQDLKTIISGTRAVDASGWEAQIRSIVDFSSQSGEWTYTYGRFNRRYFTQGIYAPGRIFMERQYITVAVDVSASMVMTPGDLEAAFGVIEELAGKYVISLLCLDEDLFIPEKQGDRFVRSGSNHPYIYKRGDWKYIKTGSSGTTFFAPLFNRYMKHHREMLLVITDGYIYDLPGLHRYSPTLWLISSGRHEPFAAPFGQAVRMEVKRK